MKIFGKVEICDHLPSANAGGSLWRGRSHWSSLAIGKQPGTESDLFILYQSARNKLGTKYKVKDNIQQVFTRYVSEGKATIRFKSPPHDVLVECDPMQLKIFLRTLNLGLHNRLPAKSLMLMNATPSAQPPKPPKRKVTILSKHTYPVLEGFPRTCQILQINSVEQKRFDKKILRLQCLRSLDLSDNKLTCLPDELDSLPMLECLYLSNNMFGTVPPNDAKWNWLNGRRICQRLQVLDLSENEIRALPVQLSKLSRLQTFKVTNNQLMELPSGIGNLSNLRVLHAGRNKLKYLPGSLKRLYFDSLDLACNAFEPISNRLLYSNLDVPSLRECAARAVIKSRLHYSSETIPMSMVSYLDNAEFCVCGTACFETFARKYVPLELREITSTLVSESVRSVVPMDAYYCSQVCVNMIRS